MVGVVVGHQFLRFNQLFRIFNRNTLKLKSLLAYFITQTSENNRRRFINFYPEPDTRFEMNNHQQQRIMGRPTLFRDETNKYLGNLRMMYSTQWYGSPSNLPDPALQFMHTEHLRAEQELLRKPTNLPRWAVSSQNLFDNLSFDYDNHLGPKWATEATYSSEINRIPLRKWESTGLGKALSNSRDDRVIVGEGTRFTVMCYNVLSPRLQDVHGYLYKECDPNALEWENRKRAFFSEIELYKPDIICLQEIEASLFPMYQKNLSPDGYRGVFKKRTRDKEDGCAIFFRDSKFCLVDKLEIEYYQPHVPILNRDNVGILIKLESKRGRKQKLVVGTTHLLFNPKRIDVKLAQVQLLLAELDRFSFCGFKQGQPVYHSTIMTGDFNTEPFTPISKLFANGFLPYVDENGQPVKSLRRRGSGEFIPPYLGVSDQCQHYRVVHERIMQQKSKKTNYIEIDANSSGALVNLHPYISTNQPLARPSENISKSMTPTATTSSLQNRFSTNTIVSDTSIAANASNTNSQTQIQDGLGNNSIADIYNDDNDVDLDDGIIQEITKTGTLCTFGSGEFSHKFQFRDINGHNLDRVGKNESLATTKQNGWVCVDYIYYSTVWNEQFEKQIEGKLKLIRRLGLLNRKQCKDIGSIPRFDIPSDHFPLVAEFLLKN